MAFEPIKFVDSLTKGVIQAVYDFVSLTAAGVAIPFISGTRYFWPAVISLNRRLSSLTYLFVWVMIALSVVFESQRKLFAAAMGTEKLADATVAVMLVTALLITMALDLSVRVACYWLVSDARRSLYKTAAHLALGNFFFGVFLVWLLTPKGKATLDHIMGLKGMQEPFGYLWFYPKPLMFIFSASLAVIIAKGLRIVKGWRVRLLLGFATSFIVALAIADISAHLVLVTENFGSWVSPREHQLSQRATRCDPMPGGVRVVGFLTLKGAASHPLDPSTIGIGYRRGEKHFVGKVRSRQPGVVLLNTSYVWVDLAADYEVNDTARTAESLKDCSFVLLKSLYEESDAPVDFSPSWIDEEPSESAPKVNSP
jgi:hypothetical protein